MPSTKNFPFVQTFQDGLFCSSNSNFCAQLFQSIESENKKKLKSETELENKKVRYIFDLYLGSQNQNPVNTGTQILNLKQNFKEESLVTELTINIHLESPNTSKNKIIIQMLEANEDHHIQYAKKNVFEVLGSQTLKQIKPIKNFKNLWFRVKAICNDGKDEIPALSVLVSNSESENFSFYEKNFEKLAKTTKLPAKRSKFFLCC